MEKRKSYSTGEFRASTEESGEKVIEGYFAMFESRTELWPGVHEKISKGAFDKSLKDGDIRCLFNHNDDIVLGRNTNSTLELKADDKGLYGKVVINENDRAAVDAHARVMRGDITGCSFGFYPMKMPIRTLDDGTIEQSIDEAELFEVSVCSFPAYPQTEIEARRRDIESTKKEQLKLRKQAVKARIEKWH
ncbi:MAG: HK97 family phage prohead protease [Lachnospiraceae bacterium]